MIEEEGAENYTPAIPKGETAHSENPDPNARKGSLLLRVRIVILLLTGAAFLVVATANRQSIIIDLIAKKIEFSLSLTLILTFFCGTITGLLLAYFRPWRKQD